VTLDLDRSRLKVQLYGTIYIKIAHFHILDTSIYIVTIRNVGKVENLSFLLLIEFIEFFILS